MKEKLERFRYWLLKKLLTESEKHLLVRAIQDRVELLGVNTVLYKGPQSDNDRDDTEIYNKLLDIVDTDYWN